MGVETALIAGLAIYAGSQIIGGAMEMGAYNDQAESYNQQASIARQESILEANQKQREIDKLAARQVMGMAKNGILTSEGSPLELLNETITLGREEVTAIVNRGNSMINYYNSLSKQSTNKGRSALIGGYAGAASTLLTGYYKGADAGLWGPNKVPKSTTTTTTAKTGGSL